MAIPVFTLKGDSKDKINFFNRYNDSHWDCGDKSIVFYNKNNYWCMTSKDFWKVILCLNSVDTTSVYHYTSRDYCVLWQVSTYRKHILLCFMGHLQLELSIFRGADEEVAEIALCLNLHHCTIELLWWVMTNPSNLLHKVKWQYLALPAVTICTQYSMWSSRSNLLLY